MRRSIIAVAICCVSASLAPAQDIGIPGVMHSGMIAGGCGGQLYPFDQQDPWLHGHFQRVPAYGGFATFRPYNYRHVFSQTQIATSVWGAPHGQAYSQQFWNHYRADYLNGNLHSQASAQSLPRSVNSLSYPKKTQEPVPAAASVSPADRPVHIYPSGVAPR